MTKDEARKVAAGCQIARAIRINDPDSYMALKPAPMYPTKPSTASSITMELIISRMIMVLPVCPK
jgi:hypothetical protein